MNAVATPNEQDTNQNEQQKPAEVTPMQKIEQRASVIMADLGAGLTGIRALYQTLATEVIIPARALFTRNRDKVLASGKVAEKDGKAVKVTVPDWDGRSQAYKDWFKESFRSIVTEHVSDPAMLHSETANANGTQDFAGPFFSTLQNVVQNAIKDSAMVKPEHLRALGLSGTKKATTAAEKKKNANGNGRTNTNDTPAADAWLASESVLEGKPVKDDEGKDTDLRLDVLGLSQHIAHCAEILSKRTRNGVAMLAGEKTQFDAFTKQALSHINSARANQDKNQLRTNEVKTS